VAVIAFLAAAAMAATFFPARRAAAVDPVEALRTQ
jgi:ABC-type lipoprotein release transport system permease subunit